ncbi:MAG TPA: M1 family metallopeptidase [Thermoanaerobaculia bacterium]
MTRPRTARLAALAALLAAARLDAGPRVPAVASYTIEASVSAEHVVAGKETVRFTNRTQHAFTDLALHLYLNAWRNDRSTWLVEQARGGGRADRGLAAKDPARWGWSEIHRIALDDGTDLTPGLRYVSPDDGNPDDRTLVSVPLPRPVAPGETLVFRVDWEAKFPRAVARTGWKDDYLLGAQWFPKLGVATDAGWNAHQFHAGTEFFADFGDYDVTLALPAANKGHIGGTGVLKEEAELAGGLVRARFLAEDVHDFAFAACPRFEVVRDTFSAKGLPNVDIVLLLQPDHRPLRDRYLQATKVGLEDFGTRYLAYPYPVVTVVDPPWGSHTEGMEYPTLFVGGGREIAPKRAHSPESVTIHEYGHQVFYGMLASNEVEEAHLDEGFNSYATTKALEAAYGHPSLVVRFYGLPVTFGGVTVPYPFGATDRFHRWRLAWRSDAQAVPSYRQLNGDAVRNNAYLRTTLLLRSCERTFGDGLWAKVMKTYATRFAFKHPTTADFLGVVREVAGALAADSVAGIVATAGSVDYAVTAVETHEASGPTGFSGEGSERKFEAAKKGGTGTFESTVVVQRFGEAVWPVDVVFTFADGSTLTRPWSGAESWVRWRLRGPKLVSAEVDPARKCLLDGNTLNNGRRTEPDPRASRAWTARFMFWAQNLLEAFSLLGWAVLP